MKVVVELVESGFVKKELEMSVEQFEFLKMVADKLSNDYDDADNTLMPSMNVYEV